MSVDPSLPLPGTQTLPGSDLEHTGAVEQEFHLPDGTVSKKSNGNGSDSYGDYPLQDPPPQPFPYPATSPEPPPA